MKRLEALTDATACAWLQSSTALMLAPAVTASSLADEEDSRAIGELAGWRS
jgi:hypothetical protein